MRSGKAKSSDNVFGAVMRYFKVWRSWAVRLWIKSLDLRRSESRNNFFSDRSMGFEKFGTDGQCDFVL